MEIIKYATLTLYIITGLAGFLKLLTYWNYHPPLINEGGRDRRIFHTLFFLYTRYDFENAESPFLLRMMRFSNYCAYVFYVGALLTIVVFCITYSLFFG